MKSGDYDNIINDFVSFATEVIGRYKLWKNSEIQEIKEICLYINNKNSINRLFITGFLCDEIELDMHGLKPYVLPILQDLTFTLDEVVKARLLNIYLTTLRHDPDPYFRDQAISTMMILGIRESRDVCLEYINQKLDREGTNATYYQMVLFLNVDLEEGARLVSRDLCVRYTVSRESLGLQYEPALLFLIAWSKRFNNGALEHVISAIRLNEKVDAEEVISTIEYVLCRRPFHTVECEYFRKLSARS